MSSLLLKEELKKYPFSTEHINDEKNVDYLDKLADSFVMHSEVSGAYTLLLNIKKKFGETSFKKNHPHLYDRYQVPLAKLQLVAFHALSEADALEFLRTNFVKFLDNYWIDVFGRVRLFLINEPLISRDEFKRKFLKAIEENREYIGRNKIKDKLGKLHPPTLGNWLKIYKEQLGAGHHNDIEIQHFLLENEEFDDLSDKEKAYLRDSIMFYELMKITSDNPQSIDAPMPSLFKHYGEQAAGEEKPEDLIAYRVEEPDKPKNILMPEESKIISPPTQPEPEPLPNSEPARSAVDMAAPAPAKKLVKQEHPAVKQAPREVRPTGHRPPGVDIRPPRPPQPTERLGFPSRQYKQQETQNNLSRLEDIRRLTVADFRRFGQDPKEIAANIATKIQRLVAGTPLDRIKARNFLKDSSLYKLYLAMGEESMKREKSVADIAKDRSAKSLPYLSEGEFEAVAEITSKI